MPQQQNYIFNRLNTGFECLYLTLAKHTFAIDAMTNGHTVITLW